MKKITSSIDPHQVATDIFGDIDWQDPVTGFCQCPGTSAHTHKTSPRDCRVSLDGAPTAHCFHNSCASGLAEFRSPCEWMEIGPAMGNFTCGSSFARGTFRRSNECVQGQRFLVVESDLLTRDEVGAVFRYLTVRLHYRLHCIIDTAGKSLHGWFDAPPNPLVESRLKAALEVFGCDPKMFTYSQPVRVPGAFRDGRLQRLIWLRE